MKGLRFLIGVGEKNGETLSRELQNHDEAAGHKNQPLSKQYGTEVCVNVCVLFLTLVDLIRRAALMA